MLLVTCTAAGSAGAATSFASRGSGVRVPLAPPGEMSAAKIGSSRLTPRSTSPTRTAPGSAPATRTPTACCASTSPKAPTSHDGAPKRSKRSPPHSTTGPARHSAGRPPPKHSASSYCLCKTVLHPPVESAQYTSKDYAALAAANGVVLSVSRKGECWDNAVAESFFATIKRELISDRAWPTRAGLHRAIFD